MVPLVMEPTAAVAKRSTRAEEGSLVGFWASNEKAESERARSRRERAISMSKFRMPGPAFQVGSIMLYVPLRAVRGEDRFCANSVFDLEHVHYEGIHEISRIVDATKPTTNPPF